MVADEGTVAFNDLEAQTILDSHRVDLYRAQLSPIAVNVGGTTQYLTFLVGAGDLETVDSGSAAWQVWDGDGGTIGTAEYAVDYQRGVITFNTTQGGSARFVDARSYDLHGAASHGWREWAGSKAHLYKFSADGAAYDRNQWFEHALAMAAHYDALATTGAGALNVGYMFRSDVNPTPSFWEW